MVMLLRADSGSSSLLRSLATRRVLQMYNFEQVFAVIGILVILACLYMWGCHRP